MNSWLILNNAFEGYPTKLVSFALLVLCFISVSLAPYLATLLAVSYLGYRFVLAILKIPGGKSELKNEIIEASNWVCLVLCRFYLPELSHVCILWSSYTTFLSQVPSLQPTVRLICYMKPIVFTALIDSQDEQNKLEASGSIFIWGFFMACCFWVAWENSGLDRAEITSRQLHSVIDTVTNGLFVIDSFGQVVKVNLTCKEAFNASSASDAAKVIEVLSYSETGDNISLVPKLCKPDFLRYLNSGDENAIELGLTKIADRTYKLIAKRLIWEEDPALLVIMQDITAGLELQLMKVESHSKDAILRSVSHELRTPTSGVMQIIQAVCLADDLPQWAKNKLEISVVCCKHLLLLINDLLDYSQLVSGKFRLTLTHFHLRKSLQDSIDILKLSAACKGIELQLQVDPLIPKVVYSDERRLSQIIMNLLGNAIKFTPKGGRVELTALLNEDGMLEVIVSDTGIGITQKEIDSLFTLFGRLESSSSVNPHGVGLGLHISNKLALELGKAQIKVKSIIGEGSCFIFIASIFEKERLVPKTDSFFFTDSSCEIATAQKVYKFLADNAHLAEVLVVDDSSFNRLAIVDILRTAHIQCEESDSGLEAIDIILDRAEKNKPFKVVLMDYEMPEINGPTACRRILHQLRERELPIPKIIAHSAYDTLEDKQICIEAGMVDYLPKPSSRDFIVETLLRNLRN